MGRCSNNLIGIINFFVFLFSIFILAGGTILNRNASTECQSFFDKPLIALGVFFMVVAIAGFVGSCFRVTWLLWVYLCVMLLLILVFVCVTVFAFVVTKKGEGQTVPGRGYKEYRLGDYSHWLQKRVNSAKSWNKIRTCLVESKVCPKLQDKLVHAPLNTFYNQHLTAIQSGCCKPSEQCGFTYVSATNWTKTTAGTNANNLDCQTWDNAPDKLCFDCQSCKAGILDNVKSASMDYKITNIINLFFLIGFYIVCCYAIRNNMRDESYGSRA